jgi:hypothetical protein
LSVSLEIFQSFISRSFIFDGDPPPPLGRFTIVRGVVGRARGLRPRDGGPARRCSAALPGGRLRRAPGRSRRRAGSRRRCGCGLFRCTAGNVQNRGLAGPGLRYSVAYASLCCARVGDNASASFASRAEPRCMHRLKSRWTHATQCWYALSNLE